MGLTHSPGEGQDIVLVGHVAYLTRRRVGWTGWHACRGTGHGQARANHARATSHVPHPGPHHTCAPSRASPLCRSRTSPRGSRCATAGGQGADLRQRKSDDSSERCMGVSTALRARASPIPLAAPVTTAVRPRNAAKPPAAVRWRCDCDSASDIIAQRRESVKPLNCHWQ